MVQVVVVPVALPAALAAVRTVVWRLPVPETWSVNRNKSLHQNKNFHQMFSIENIASINMLMGERMYLGTGSQSLAPSSHRMCGVGCRLRHLSF